MHANPIAAQFEAVRIELEPIENVAAWSELRQVAPLCAKSS
ncbi:hypothetical protein [Croceicoccus ponticola]|nr:hypothetical protein [Croceicoccus ponticola]